LRRLQQGLLERTLQGRRVHERQGGLIGTGITGMAIHHSRLLKSYVHIPQPRALVEGIISH
jgi:hypothetical protein